MGLTSSMSLADVSEEFSVVADRIRKLLLRDQDIRRTDLRFADVLKMLPPQIPTLLQALEQTPTSGSGDPLVLIECLSAAEQRLLELKPHKIEQELIDGVRPLFESEEELQLYARRMGWIDGVIVGPTRFARKFGLDLQTVVTRDAYVKSRVREAGLYAPKLTQAIQLAEKFAPTGIGYIADLIKHRSFSKLNFQRWTLLAAADLVGIPHQIHYLPVGQNSFYSRIPNRSYPHFLVRYARRMLAEDGIVSMATLVTGLDKRLGIRVEYQDIAIMLRELMTGVEWLDKQRTAFRFVGSVLPDPGSHIEDEDWHQTTAQSEAEGNASEEQVFEHRLLWASAIRMRDQAEGDPQNSLYFDISAMVLVRLTLQAYCNFLLDILFPKTFAIERETFGTDIETKLRWLSVKIDYPLELNARPYYTVENLESFGDQIVHASRKADADTTGPAKDAHSWTSGTAKARALALKDISRLCEAMHEKALEKATPAQRVRLQPTALKAVRQHQTTNTQLE